MFYVTSAIYMLFNKFIFKIQIAMFDRVISSSQVRVKCCMILIKQTHDGTINISPNAIIKYV